MWESRSKIFGKISTEIYMYITYDSFPHHPLPPLSICLNFLPLPSVCLQFLSRYRQLFAEAETEQKSMGINSALHIIIFDELDAICKQRGTVVSGWVYIARVGKGREGWREEGEGVIESVEGGKRSCREE